jgi:hypothetical protein
VKAPNYKYQINNNDRNSKLIWPQKGAKSTNIKIINIHNFSHFSSFKALFGLTSLGLWIFEFGYYLEFGYWDLGF